MKLAGKILSFKTQQFKEPEYNKINKNRWLYRQ
jgi:hypothetical protein